MKPSAERIALVERLKATLPFPLSEFELAMKASAIAKVKAEDERKRAPTPQLPLEQAA